MNNEEVWGFDDHLVIPERKVIPGNGGAWHKNTDGSWTWQARHHFVFLAEPVDQSEVGTLKYKAT